MSQAITEAMVKAARDAFKAKCGITIYLPGEGTLDDFEMERYDALKDALSAALAAAQARPAVVKPLVSTQRLDDLICAGVPTSDETHDMAVELLNHRRSIPALVSQPVAIKPLEWEEFKTDFKRSFQANTVVGQYQIGYLGEFEEWQLYSPGAPSWRECFTRHVSVSAAKIAARVAYEARIRSALVPPAVPGEVERMQDKIEGLEADLENAVEVAFKRGATEWTRLNYPDRYATLSASVPLPEIEGETP